MRQTNKTRQLVLTALMAVLTAVGAFLRIPVGVSSFTLQFFFTAMAGVLLGPAWGALSQAVYVILGLVGLPVFTGGGGFAYVLQPTFGFLLGLIPAAWTTGMLSQGRVTVFSLIWACVAGLAVLYLVGLPYMHLILTRYLNRDWTLWQSIFGGMIIFLPWDALKIAATALLGSRLCPILRPAKAASAD